MSGTWMTPPPMPKMLERKPTPRLATIPSVRLYWKSFGSSMMLETGLWVEFQYMMMDISSRKMPK